MEEINIQELADGIAANLMICTKEVLTSNEAARYMGVSKSHLYRLTMNFEIPFYKPTGKLIFLIAPS